MAIGDAVAAYMGAAAGNRQPTSGVEEHISAIVKPANNDALFGYDGTTTVDILIYNATSQDVSSAPAERYANDMNLGLMITNAFYFRKTGGTDHIGIHGVQTNV